MDVNKYPYILQPTKSSQYFNEHEVSNSEKQLYHPMIIISCGR